MDWSLLLLRLGVGGLALFQGFLGLRHAHGGATFAHAAGLGLALGEMICGGLVVIGLWTWLVAALLAGIVGWPLVNGWIHGAGLLAHPSLLFRFLVTLACAIGGGGKWAVDR
ncbi:MAG TPA: hypothetical protein VF768_00115 [Holophagaceae bacterium]